MYCQNCGRELADNVTSVPTANSELKTKKYDNAHKSWNKDKNGDKLSVFQVIITSEA